MVLYSTELYAVLVDALGCQITVRLTRIAAAAESKLARRKFAQPPAELEE